MRVPYKSKSSESWLFRTNPGVHYQHRGLMLLLVAASSTSIPVMNLSSTWQILHHANLHVGHAILPNIVLPCSTNQGRKWTTSTFFHAQSTTTMTTFSIVWFTRHSCPSTQNPTHRRHPLLRPPHHHIFQRCSRHSLKASVPKTHTNHNRLVNNSLFTTVFTSRTLVFEYLHLFGTKLSQHVILSLSFANKVIAACHFILSPHRTQRNAELALNHMELAGYASRRRTLYYIILNFVNAMSVSTISTY